MLTIYIFCRGNSLRVYSSSFYTENISTLEDKSDAKIGLFSETTKNKAI